MTLKRKQLTPFQDLFIRTPGALEAVTPESLGAVLDRLGVTEAANRAAAAINYHDDPLDALALVARRCDIVGNLLPQEIAFADARYEESLSNALFAKDPEPLAGILGMPVGTRSGGQRLSSPPAVSEPFYQLFPHQRRAVNSAMRRLSVADTRVLLHMPTGSGKTRSAMSVVCGHLSTRDPGVVVWAASTKELLDQAAREFNKAWMHLGNRTLAIGHGWDGGTVDAARIDDGFISTTLQGLHSLATSHAEVFDALADRCTLMVFDEAHQAIARTYSHVTERIADRARLLGLSATPGRTAVATERSDRALAEFFGHKVRLDTSDEGESNPVRYLVTKGYLAKTDFRVVRIDRPEVVLRDPQYSGTIDDVYTEQVVDLLRVTAVEHKRVMVFAASVEHARLIAAASTGCGVPARFVVGEMEKQARNRAIYWFREPSTESRAIINYGVLSTGFDAPKVSATIIARPTTSLVLYSQMVGRAIRGPEADGTSEALVLTVVDTDNPAFSSMAAAFENWEDLWETKE